nr:Chain C, Myelin basic protein [Homo sapiens]1ZGL_F Chain F, Myelin basic protein [Homo sapiens]1ZGL_I Chain I, Myelin basic protein [Homo sapiens]1ZGL_L Chain L, Myelin basic protein [Homo sapiens]
VHFFKNIVTPRTPGG